MTTEAAASPFVAGPRRAVPVALVVLAVALAAGWALPAIITSTLLLTLATQALINGVLATGVGFLVKQNGVVSFGHAVFYGMGAYVIALALKTGTVSAELAILAALAIPTLLAFGLGLVIVRIPGVAFSMLTLAIDQAFYEVVLKWRELANGDDGLAISFPRELFGVETALFQRPGSMFTVCWVALVLVVAGLYWLSRSQLGLLTEAIRENEERSRFIGYRTVVPRALIYAVSAFIGALGGVLFALYNTFVSPEILHWTLSGSALIMAIIGGTRALWGPALGAVVFFFLKDIVGDATEHWPAIIGLILIAVTVLLPQGLSGALLKARDRAFGRRAAP